MSGMFHHLGFHVVFKTKYRTSVLSDPISDRLHEMMATLAREEGARIVHVGGVEDHVHVYMELRPGHRLSDVVQRLKSRSSFWLRREFNELHRFRWQKGYAAFSVSRSAVPQVIAYIQRQREHHRRMTVEDEFRALLARSSKHDNISEEPQRGD